MPTTQELIEYARGATWSDFATSVVRQYDDGRSLTPRQIAALERMQGKDANRSKAKSAAAALELPLLAAAVPLTGFLRCFTSDKRVLTVKHAKRRPLLYVQVDGAYAGAITVEGKGQPAMAAPNLLAGVQGDLEALQRDPMGALLKYGRESGICGVCGRELTDPASVEAGIGPVCATKFG